MPPEKPRQTFYRKGPYSAAGKLSVLSNEASRRRGCTELLAIMTNKMLLFNFASVVQNFHRENSLFEDLSCKLFSLSFANCIAIVLDCLLSLIMVSENRQKSKEKRKKN